MHLLLREKVLAITIGGSIIAATPSSRAIVAATADVAWLGGEAVVNS